MPAPGRNLKQLRRMAAYAHYRMHRGDDEAAIADLQALTFALGMLLELRRNHHDLFVEVVATYKPPRLPDAAPLDPPKVFTPRRLREYGKELDRRGNRPAADTARVLAELIA